MIKFLHLPVDGSAHGPEIDSMLAIIHWLMLVLFIGWGAFFLYTLIRFRKKKNPTADYAGVKSHISSYLEIGVALFEAVLLIGFAVPLWAKRVNSFPAEKDATVVRIVAEQFAWNVHYPGADGVFGRTDISLITDDNPLGLDRSDPYAKDDITTINQLHIPVDKPVIIRLSTKDVIHSFNLPTMRIKQDAIPGQVIPVWFTPTKTTDQMVAELAEPFQLTAGDTSSKLFERIAIQDYRAKDSTVILKKGDVFTPDVVKPLLDAGVTEVLAAPNVTTEIACAQLCGLGHYRMRGYLSVDTKKDYDAWMADQVSQLPHDSATVAP
ncbi:MAG: cytochrome c oxidase subunit II [Bacteroidota bacterium]